MYASVLYPPVNAIKPFPASNIINIKYERSVAAVVYARHPDTDAKDQKQNEENKPITL